MKEIVNFSLILPVPKVARSHMKGFVKTTKVKNISRIFKVLFAAIFRYSFMRMLPAFGNPFMTAPMASLSKSLSTNRRDLENTRNFQ